MISTDTVRTVVGILGVVISFGLFVSPSSMFLRIGRMRATDENFSVYPYVSILFNCSMYVIYMVHDHEKDTLVMVINAIGIGFQTIFICIALWFGTRRQKVIILVALVAETIIVSSFIFWLYGGSGSLPSLKHSRRVLGWMCVVSGGFMYASTSPSLWNAWRIHSTESVPLSLTGAATANSIVWLLNGFFSGNPYQLIQNCMGVVFCSVQIALYAWIRYHPFEASN